MQTIYLDISNKGVYPCIRAKQEEVGRRFLAVITDNGVPYKIPNNALLSVWYDGDSGSGNYSSIGENSAFEIDGNNIAVELVLQMLSVPGNGELCLTITHGDGREISSWNIPYCVEKKPGAGSSVPTEYYTALTEAGAYAAEQVAIAKQYADQAAAATENKLDLTGGTMAGDIAMDGRKVTGLGTPITSGDAVPLGYALGAFLPVGTTAEQIGAATEAFAKAIGLPCYGDLSFDIDETMPSQGVYRLNDSYGVNGMNAGFFIQLGQYEDYNTRYGLQIACDFLGRICVRSRWYDSYINEWDWVNPQMSTGVEYRTAERWNGNPVFVKLINFGYLPDAGGEKRVSAGIPEWPDISIVDVNGVIYNPNENAYFSLNAPKNITAYIYDGKIIIESEASRTHQTAKILVKYIKL